MTSLIQFLIAASCFAWFNYNATVQKSIVTTTGEVTFDDTALKAGCYKYEYPTYTSGSNSSTSTSSSVVSSSSEEPLYNYDGVGSVVTSDLLTTNLKMNKYDPFYLSLNPTLHVKDLMTNIVICFETSFTATTDVTFNLNLVRYTTEWDTTKYRLSNYVDFWITSDDLSRVTSVTYPTTSGTTYTNTSDVVFYSMKTYDEANTSTKFSTYANGVSNKIALTTANYSYADDMTSIDNSLSKSKTLKFYVGMDYDETLLADYTSLLTADQNLNLGMDFYFQLEALQNV